VIYGSKWLIFLFPAVTLGLIIFIFGAFRFDPFKQNLLRSTNALNIVYNLTILIVATLFMQIIMKSMKIGDLGLLNNINYPVGFALIVVGNYLPTIKRSFFGGIPTPWTMKSDLNWVLTHRFAGKVLIIVGTIVMFGSLMTNPLRGRSAGICIFLGLILIYIYSYVIYNKEEKCQNY
jgi:uncharacterized membrane protein